ncbi:MAG: hypothetical protein AAF824_24020 [Bacteroidota bacterium]
MARGVPPLYGYFVLEEDLSFPALLERMHLISDHFFHEEPFHTYLILKNEERYYGLDHKELEELYTQHSLHISKMSSLLSSSTGRSVRINLEFPKQSQKAQGKYVIATGRTSLNTEIEEMIRGMWTPRPDPDPIPLPDLLAGVKNYLQAQKPTPVKSEIEKTKAEIQYFQDSFFAERQIGIEKIIDLLREVSVIFLNNTPFSIQLATTRGILYLENDYEELRKYFRTMQANIFRIHMSAQDGDRQSVEIKLQFDPFSVEPNAETEIVAFEGDEILDLIRETLSLQSPVSKVEGTEIAFENFRFNEAYFNLEKLISVVNTLSADYLERTPPSATFTNRNGAIFPRLSLHQLRELYDRYLDSVERIAISMKQVHSYKVFSLHLQFGNRRVDAYGTYAVNWDDPATHASVRKLLWDRLSLRPFTSPMTSKGVGEGEISMNPSFKGRSFSPKRNHCLVSMPLEAYWSETLWIHIQTTLQTVGVDSERSGNLFQENFLEPFWNQINEVDMMVADLTYKHPDVFYKIGVAHTLGKRVILIAQHERDVPRDFRRFPVIIYNNNIPGLRKLAEGLIMLIHENT